MEFVYHQNGTDAKCLDYNIDGLWSLSEASYWYVIGSDYNVARQITSVHHPMTSYRHQHVKNLATQQ